MYYIVNNKSVSRATYYRYKKLGNDCRMLNSDEYEREMRLSDDLPPFGSESDVVLDSESVGSIDDDKFVLSENDLINNQYENDGYYNQYESELGMRYETVSDRGSVSESVSIVPEDDSDCSVDSVDIAHLFSHT